MYTHSDKKRQPESWTPQGAPRRVLVAGLTMLAVLYGSYAHAAVTSAQSKKHHAKKHHATSPVSVGEVSASAQGRSYLGSHQAKGLTQAHNFTSGQSIKVLGKEQIAAAGPLGGSAQALSYAPGVGVTGFGSTGATKTSISINGIKQGWSGYTSGQIDNGSLSVEFDGVPMVDPGTGLWQSSLVPQNSILQGIQITYGPGNPRDRWYNNIGGQIDLVPLQPTAGPGADISLTYGSYDSKDVSFDVRTGDIHGWSTILAAGIGSSNSYRESPNGFDNPSNSYAWFFKTRKTFSNGDFSLGAYLAKGAGFRPVPIPVEPIAGVTETGAPGSPLYSQPTSGFYSSLPNNVWNKLDTNQIWMIYSKLNVALDRYLGFHNMIWYRHGQRLHQHYNDYGLTNPANLYEYNNPHDDVYGDKLWFSVSLPYNELSVGGYFLHSRYNTRNSFYNPSDGGSIAIPNAKYRSDYFDQTFLAAFVQDRIHPTKNLDITPGVRFINLKTNYTPAGPADFPGAYATDPGHDQGQLPAASTQFSEVEPSVDLNWRALHWLAAFANYAQTYKEPQFGGGGGLFQSQAPIYNLEKGTDYNAGIKLHFVDLPYLHNFLATVSYYHLHYANQYIPLFNANGDFIGDANGDSLYHGFNIAVDDDLLYNLHVFANANFEQAHFNHYVTSGTSYEGLPVSNVPDQTFNIGASYRYFLAGILIEPRLWYQYVGAQALFDSNTGTPSTTQMPSYGTLNLGIDSTIPMRGHSSLRSIDVSFNVLNLTNKHYNEVEYISSGGLLGGASQGQILALPGAPLTAYISISAHF